MTSVLNAFQNGDLVLDLVVEKSANGEQAASINIDGGVFTQVGGDYKYYDIQGDLHQHSSELGLYTLGQYISHSAIHDSSERFPPPRCHPETRQRVRELIMEWIEDRDPVSTILWVYGPAGAGKSAILQSIAEWCLESGNCSASFFFTRGKHGRDQGRYLFPTISYQLALSIPGLRGHVDQIMTSMPGCHMKTMSVQIRTLIIDSLSRLQEHPASGLTPTVIIDGLDECESVQVQQVILDLIADARVIFNVPLRFLIASRPEAHIRESFDSPPLLSITHRLVLDDTFNPDGDIAVYLQDGFEDIYQKNIAIMSHIEKPWPKEEVIVLLVQKASGQFIYADTVLKFVGAELRRPSKQLEAVLKNSPDSSNLTPFRDLDVLYTQILSTSPHRQTLLSILGVILALHCPQPPQVIEGILDLEPGEVNLVLRPVLSLVRVPGFEDDNLQPDKEDSTSDEKDGTRFYHASFHDYLVDESRSGAFYINLEWAKTQLTLAGFRLITTRVSSSQPCLNIPDLRTWGYLKWHLSPHFWQCGEQYRGDIIRMLQEARQQFWKNKSVDPPDDVLYEALHCAVTALIHMMYTKRKWPETWQSWHYSDVGIDQTLTGLLDEYPNDPENILDPIVSEIFHEYRDEILDQCYDHSFSSGSVGRLLDSVPGFLVMGREQTYEITSLILGVDIKTISSLVEENRIFIWLNRYSSDPVSRILFRTHPRDYICDENRSGRHFRNPKLHHIAICHRALWYTFEQHWSFQTDESTGDARRYFGNNFGRHLKKVNFDPSDDEICTTALLEFLNHLGRLTFCQASEQYNAPFRVLNIIWFAISRILQWIQKQRLEYSGDSSKIKEKLDFSRNRIYSQILCKEIKDEETVVDIRPHFLATKKWWRSPAKKESIEAGSFEFASDFNDVETPCERISDDFLLFEDIIPSLTEYITDASHAGGLYISPEVYHTQFAEYWLERCSARDRASPSDPIEKAKSEIACRNWSNHLVHALPTERIFDRLRNIYDIYDFGLIHDTIHFIDSIRLIIAWLETLPEPPLDIYLRWQMAILEQEQEDALLADLNAQSPATVMESQPAPSLSENCSSERGRVNGRWVYLLWTIRIWFFSIFQTFWAPRN